MEASTGLDPNYKVVGPFLGNLQKTFGPINPYQSYRKSILPTGVPAVIFKQKSSSTLSPFATKHRIQDIESKIQLIYFLTTVKVPKQ